MEQAGHFHKSCEYLLAACPGFKDLNTVEEEGSFKRSCVMCGYIS